MWDDSQSYSCIGVPVTMEKTEKDFRYHLFPLTVKKLLIYSPRWAKIGTIIAVLQLRHLWKQAIFPSFPYESTDTENILFPQGLGSVHFTQHTRAAGPQLNRQGESLVSVCPRLCSIILLLGPSVSPAWLGLPHWVPATWGTPLPGQCASVCEMILESDGRGSPWGNLLAEPDGRGGCVSRGPPAHWSTCPEPCRPERHCCSICSCSREVSGWLPC